MTATPLPPLPSTLISGQYTSSDMKAFANAARADLEAEVQRLREALEEIIENTHDIGAIECALAALGRQA